MPSCEAVRQVRRRHHAIADCFATQEAQAGVDDGGIVSCVDPATGEAHYRERIGGKYSASPIVADNKLYFASREGVITTLPVSKEFKILAQNTLDGSLMASPIAVDGALYLRTDKALYRIAK